MTAFEGEYSQSYTIGDLIEDGRYDEAERILDAFAHEQPDETWALSLRAVCLAELKRHDEAIAVARTATRRAPSEAYGHWVLGVLLVDRDRLDEAQKAAEAAIALEPNDARNHGLKAQVHAKRGEWDACRVAADAGLALDPSDEVCRTLRALSLRPTTSGEDWQSAVDDLLEQYPASAWARSGKGWGLLERGRAAEARVHFEQAVALDPTSDWARHGLIESIKAQNPLYAAMLRFFLWMERLPTRTRWILILGGLFLFRVLRRASEAEPAIRWVAYPLMALWIVFILASWVGKPLSNFFLSRTRVGRGLVRGEDRLAANLVAGVLGLALATFLFALVSDVEATLLTAMALGFLVIPVSATFHCMPGWPRTVMGTYAATNAVAALFTFSPNAETAGTAFGISLVMSVLGSWLGAFLSSRIPAC